MNLAEIADRLAIADALARYARGVDRLDAELIRSTYWPDAQDDHGPFQGSRDEFVAWVIPFLREHYAAHSHMLGQSHIRLAGTRAGVETYFTAWELSRDTEGDHIGVIGGRYADRFEKRADEWRIARRTVVFDWTGGFAAGTFVFPHAAGTRTGSDPSYRILAE